ncbi:MAG: hypothetical protein ACI31C_06730 [Muribaculaceae bacterium]
MPTNCKKIILYISIALTTIGAIGWLGNTWCYSDDLCYAREVTDNGCFWVCDGSPITTWSQVWSSIYYHYIYVNGRLANAVLFPLQMCPRWVGMGIAGALIGVLMWLLYRAGRLDRSRISLRWIALGPALLWLALPWYNNFQSMAYQYNYVPASICMLTVLYLMRDATTLSQRRLWIAVVAGALTGLLHEGFAGTLGVALCVMWLMERSVARRRIGYVIIATGVCMAVCVVSGTIDRIEIATVAVDLGNLKYLLTNYLKQLWPLWTSVVLWSIYAHKYRGSERLKQLNKVALPLLAGALVNIAVSALLLSFHRVLWPCHICCILLIMIITSEWIGSTSPRRGAVVVMSVATALYALWLGGVVYWECRVSDMQRNFFARSSQPGVAGSGVLYTDMDTLNVPFWTMQLATNEEYESSFFSFIFSIHFNASTNLDNEPLALLLPMSCQGKTYEQWDSIPGTAHMRGKYPYVAVESIDARFEKGPFSTYYCNIVLELGEPTIECTPIERAAYWLKRQLGIDVDHIEVRCTIYPMTVDGVKRGRAFFDKRPIGFNSREVLRIDYADQL